VVPLPILRKRILGRKNIKWKGTEAYSKHRKMTGGVAQAAAACLPSKWEALSSTASNIKKKKKSKKKKNR
jgi:hypothetical protein